MSKSLSCAEVTHQSRLPILRMSPLHKTTQLFYVASGVSPLHTVTDVCEFSLYWSRCLLFGDVITMKSSLVLADIMAGQGGKWFLGKCGVVKTELISSVALAESMGCQGGKWFLGKCGVIINKYSWAHLFTQVLIHYSAVSSSLESQSAQHFTSLVDLFN